MPSSTPNKAIPYAVDNDARALWPSTSQDAAERVDELLTAMDTVHHAAITDATVNALGNGAWTNIAYDSASGVMAYDGTNLSYSGPARWFLISFGANVAVNGTQPTGALRLLLNGSIGVEAYHSDNYAHLSGCIPLLMGAGTDFQTITLAAYANDGSGALGGGYDRAYLRVASIAG
jgi:hypothetical protein